MQITNESVLKTTALNNLHRALGARMVEFAGYDMPVHYPMGVLEEHRFTRLRAGLFDVSHMGQAILSGSEVAAKLERLVPGDIVGLRHRQIRYTQLLDDHGRILDDLMITRLHGENSTCEQFLLVVNAATKTADFALIAGKFPDLHLEILDDRALIALQGPEAAALISEFYPLAAELPFMHFTAIDESFWLSRSGYTGEDGYEISLPNEQAESFAKRLLEHSTVRPIGLGARDSLRLEAGLCLYGHDITDQTTPVEAGLSWSISKRRRLERGFPGADILQKQWAEGPKKLRVGILPCGKAPAREGTIIQSNDGESIGVVTSGAYGPTLNRPIAMGFVASSFAVLDNPVNLIVRNKSLPAKIAALPFVPNRFHRTNTK